jgi:hypothetical protein
LKALQRWAIGVVEPAQDPGDGVQDERGIAYGGEIHEDCAVVKLGGHPGGQLDRKPRLTDTRRTGNGDEPHGAAQNQVLRGLQVRVAAEE